MTDKIRVDLASLTLRQLDEIADLLGGVPLAKVMETQQGRGLAAVACVVKRRTDPTFSLEDALDLPMDALDVVNLPETVGDGSNGDAPRPSPASGPLTQSA